MKFCEDKIMCRLWWIGENIFNNIDEEDNIEKEMQRKSERNWNYQDMTLYVDPNYRL